MDEKKKMPKMPKIPVVSIILMLIFTVGGSLLICVKNTSMLSIGLDWPSLIVCFLSYLLIIGGAFYYAYFEKID